MLITKYILIIELNLKHIVILFLEIKLKETIRKIMKIPEYSELPGIGRYI